MENELNDFDIDAIGIALLRPFLKETLRLLVRKQLGGVS